MPNAKTEGAGFLSKSEKAKLQSLYIDIWKSRIWINYKSTKGKWVIQKESLFWLCSCATKEVKEVY